MAEPPPAPALGALREQHEQHGAWCAACGVIWPCDAVVVLQAFDAQAARLAAVTEAAERMASDLESCMDYEMRTHVDQYCQCGNGVQRYRAMAAGAVGEGRNQDSPARESYGGPSAARESF